LPVRFSYDPEMNSRQIPRNGIAATLLAALAFTMPPVAWSQTGAGDAEEDTYRLPAFAVQGQQLGYNAKRGSTALKFSLPILETPQSLIVTVLRMRGRTIGFLGAVSYTRGKKFDEGQRKLLSIVANRAAAAIENAQLYEDLKATFHQTIKGLASAIDKMDRYTAGHSERVAAYAQILAIKLGLPEADVEIVRQSALMHDVGKIGCAMNLNKPGKLSQEEYDLLMHGGQDGRKTFEGVLPGLRRWYEKSESNWVREYLSKYMAERVCPDCHGDRLRLTIGMVRHSNSRQSASSRQVLKIPVADIAGPCLQRAFPRAPIDPEYVQRHAVTSSPRLNQGLVRPCIRPQSVIHVRHFERPIQLDEGTCKHHRVHASTATEQQRRAGLVAKKRPDRVNDQIGCGFHLPKALRAWRGHPVRGTVPGTGRVGQ